MQFFHIRSSKYWIPSQRNSSCPHYWFLVCFGSFVGSKAIINGHIGEDDNLLAFPSPWWKLRTQKVPMDPGFTLTVEVSKEIPFWGLGFFLGLGNSHR